uniref:Uncharacterized protein n=1 Tax=Cacopsylla melanoneura TaxID=428564 RepID=A0A8D8Z1D5_9HEMI
MVHVHTRATPRSSPLPVQTPPWSRRQTDRLLFDHHVLGPIGLLSSPSLSVRFEPVVLSADAGRIFGPLWTAVYGSARFDPGPRCPISADLDRHHSISGQCFHLQEPSHSVRLVLSSECLFFP